MLPELADVLVATGFWILVWVIIGVKVVLSKVGNRPAVTYIFNKDVIGFKY